MLPVLFHSSVLVLRPVIGNSLPVRHLLRKALQVGTPPRTCAYHADRSGKRDCPPQIKSKTKHWSKHRLLPGVCSTSCTPGDVPTEHLDPMASEHFLEWRVPGDGGWLDTWRRGNELPPALSPVLILPCRRGRHPPGTARTHPRREAIHSWGARCRDGQAGA